MKLKRYLQNEKGNTMLIILGLLIAAIFISFIFFDYFTTYANKRVSQTSADAAALAAAQKIKELYDERLNDEIEERFDELKEDIQNEVDRRLDEEREEWEESQEDEEDEDESEEGSDAGEDEWDEEAERERIWYEVLDQLHLPAEIRLVIENPGQTLDANVALEYFFADGGLFQRNEVSEIVCHEIAATASQWQEAARHFAETNGADRNIEIDFLADDLRVAVRVKKKASFITVGELGEAGNVYAEAEASIKVPRAVDIDCG